MASSPPTETHATTEADHGGGGLPQFDTSVWAGQIAYLLVLFALLYVMVSRVFAPRLRKVWDDRASTIATAVETARQVQAEAATQAAQAKAEVEQARAEARQLAAAAKARVNAEAAERAAAEEAKIAARIAEAEASIGKTRDAALAQVGAIATETARAMVERLTGEAPAEDAARTAVTELA